MQPKKPYYEVSLINKKSRRKILVSILCFIILICIIVATTLLIQKYTFPKIKGKNFYYIYIDIDAQNATEANEQAARYRVRGGAGLTQFLDSKWRVLIALYPTLKDAQTVQTQLLTQNTQCSVGMISTPTISISQYTSEQKEVAENIYLHYLQTIDTFYTISTELDTSTITESTAQVRVTQLNLLWRQRAEQLADIINLTSKESQNHPLKNMYNLALQISGLLQFLADENDYSTNLVTYTSLTRKINIQLAQISLDN